MSVPALPQSMTQTGHDCSFRSVASSSSSCLAYAFKFVLRLIDLFLERITNVEQILLDLVNAFDVLYK